MSRIYINNDWLFAENFQDQHLCGAMDNMTKVRIPHTVKRLPFNYFSELDYQMVSAYRKVLHTPTEWANKRVFITFDGAAHYAQVFVNGQKVGEHKSGYTAFTIELTNNLNLGQDNILVVKLDSNETLNVPPFGNVIDYLTYGGIYRDVYVDVKEPTYIADVFVKPDISGKTASNVTIDGTIAPNTTIRQTATLVGAENAEPVMVIEQTVDSNQFAIQGVVQDVQLWDLEHPNRYLVQTELLVDGVVVDVHSVKVGFRSAKFCKDGFYLNGKRVQIRGLNRHQSYAYVGYAMPESMQRQDAQILKNKLGVNAVRTSHYPQSHYFVDECDKLGLLVFTEIPGWQHIGNDQWKEQAIANVEEMILQYRNHPSIVIWGVRINESQDDHDFYLRTNQLAHQLDPTRQTGGVRNIRKSELNEDVYTFNEFRHDGKQPGCYPKGAVTPDKRKPYLITENNGHMFPTKSFDCEEHRVEHALRHAQVLNDVASHADICGSFSWCFFDYNTHKDFGSGDRICYHGVADMFRNLKLAGYLYASQGNQAPVLEVSSSMDIGEHPASVRGKVWIFTNTDSVKMYKNGRFIKEYVPHNKLYPHLVNSPILIDDYIGDIFQTELGFSRGKAECLRKTLNYIALNGYTTITPKLAMMALKCLVKYRMNINQIVDLYTRYVGNWGGKSTVYRFDGIKDGNVVCSVTKVPMTKMHLEVEQSATTIAEDSTYQVVQLFVKAVDENSNILHYCNQPIQVSVDGPLQIVGPSVVSLSGGMTGVYLKTIGQTGPTTITISCAQTDSVQVAVQVE